MAKEKTQKSIHLDATFLVLVLVLLTFGLVMLFSSSYAFALENYGDSFHFIKRQAVFAVAGVIGMILVSMIDYHFLKRFVFWVFGASVLLLIIVLFMPEQKGVNRWINLGLFTFQPSEVMKFSLVLLFAYLISINYKRMGTFRYGIIPFMIPLVIVLGLLYLEPHLSAMVLTIGICVIMMFVGGVKWRYFAIGGLIIVVGAVGIVLFGGIGYVEARLQSWLDPFSDVQGDTFQTVQSLLAIGSGGFWGLGLGNSRQKYLYLPEPQNDFIFAIVCEELGFIGAMAVILLFVLFVVRGFIIAARAPDRFGSMLAVGLTTQIGLQALLNVAVVTNTIPNTGISLPFFSYGGTALMMQLLQMGIVLNISRHSAIVKT